jgi:hypothetical protein
MAGVVVLLSVLFVWAVAFAGTCQDACSQQLSEDTARCKAAYDQREAELAVERQQCTALSGIARLRCYARVDLEHQKNLTAWRQCQDAAQFEAEKCVLRCQSPSTP